MVGMGVSYSVLFPCSHKSHTFGLSRGSRNFSKVKQTKERGEGVEVKI